MEYLIGPKEGGLCACQEHAELLQRHPTIVEGEDRQGDDADFNQLDAPCHKCLVKLVRKLASKG